MNFLRKFYFLACSLFLSCAPAPEIRLVNDGAEADDGMFFYYHLESNVPLKNTNFIYIQTKTWTMFNQNLPWQTDYVMIRAGETQSESRLAPDGQRIRIVPAKERKDYDPPVVVSVSDGFPKIPDEVPLEESADYLVDQISNMQVIELDDLDPYTIGDPSDIEFPLDPDHEKLSTYFK